MGPNLSVLRIAKTILEQLDSDNRLAIIREEQTAVIVHLRSKIQYSKLFRGRTWKVVQQSLAALESPDFDAKDTCAIVLS